MELSLLGLRLTNAAPPLLLACAFAFTAPGSANANHGAAGDPNLRLDRIEVAATAKSGSCTTIDVWVKNTSSQVSVVSDWRVELAVVDADGKRVVGRSETRHGLGHRWESIGGGLEDVVKASFESIELPAQGLYTVKARVDLVGDRQKEYAAHDNESEISVEVNENCADE